VFVISAPSGGGKTTLAGQILNAMPDVERSVSMTTRPPREGERDGRDYFFVSEKAFEAVRKKKGFLEHARVFGQSYGTPNAFVDTQRRRGKDILLLIDVQGARQVQKNLKDAIRVFVMPPSMEELRRRLENRSTDAPEEIQRRLKIAKREMREAGQFDYVVVNLDLAKAVDELRAIIIAERLKVTTSRRHREAAAGGRGDLQEYRSSVRLLRRRGGASPQ
jgi:guanylate kinase